MGQPEKFQRRQPRTSFEECHLSKGSDATGWRQAAQRPRSVCAARELQQMPRKYETGATILLLIDPAQPLPTLCVCQRWLLDMMNLAKKHSLTFDHHRLQSPRSYSWRLPMSGKYPYLQPVEAYSRTPRYASK